MSILPFPMLFLPKLGMFWRKVISAVINSLLKWICFLKLQWSALGRECLLACWDCHFGKSGYVGMKNTLQIYWKNIHDNLQGLFSANLPDMLVVFQLWKNTLLQAAPNPNVHPSTTSFSVAIYWSFFWIYFRLPALFEQDIYLCKSLWLKSGL